MSEASSGIDPLDDLVESFLERHRRGERPSLSEYADDHPELADRIRAVFPALLVMEELGSLGGHATGFVAGRTGAGTRVPQRLGDYVLLRAVGSGGMGIVYEAIQESLGRHVALKVLPIHHLGDAKCLERFRREARAVARLHHTHIVPVYGIGEHDDFHFYTMQFINGHGLDAVLHEVERLRSDPRPSNAMMAPGSQIDSTSLAYGLRTGCFPAAKPECGEGGARAAGAQQTDQIGAANPVTTTTPPAEFNDRWGMSDQRETQYVYSVARIGSQVALALECAHQHGVLHRDIKPSNLLLDAHGQIWVTDFGLAKVQDSDELTRTGDVVGTLRYMAPERFSGWSDPRSDTYALGATLYELLTLRPLFEGSDRVKLIERVLHESPPPLRQVDRRVPRDLETIVMKALAKEPGERYPTAAQLADDLRRFVAGRPILARRSGTVERLWRWSKRNPMLAAATGVVAAALAAVVVISLIYAREQARANRENRTLADKLTTSLAESNRLLAIRNFDRGQAAFEKDQIGPGLLWMIESWRKAVEAHDPAWQHAARANLAAWQPEHARLKAVFSHDGPVDSAAFSPDGKTILTGGDDRVARLWDAVTGQPIGQPMRHRGTVCAVAFSPDGKSLITASADKTAQRWDAATRQPIGTPIKHDGEVRAVAFSPDGKTFLTGGTDHTARLWDATTDQPIGPPILHQGRGVAAAFSPDGKNIVTSSSDGTLRLCHSSPVQRFQPILEYRDFANAIAFSPDGKTIITGSQMGTALKRDAATGVLRGRLNGRHQGAVRAVAYSPDGKIILTGGTDKTAQLWDATTDLPIGPRLRHQGPVVAAEFSPDGKTILTASSDGTVRLWDVGPVQPAQPILQLGDIVDAVAFNPDGKTIITASHDGTARQWDAATGRTIGVPLQHDQEWVLSLAFSRDGKTIVTGDGPPLNSSSRGTAKLWDAASGQPIGRPLSHQGSVTAVAFSPDGKTVVTGSQDKTIRLWEAATGAPAGPPLPQPGTVDAGAFSPDGKAFVAAYDIGEARLWDVATWTPSDRSFPHPGAVSAVAFSPDSKILLTGCEDNMARLWDVASRTLLVPPLPNQGWVFCVAFSPDGKTVLTGSREGKAARLWDVGTGMPLGPPFRHPSGVTAVAFSPDGKKLLTGSNDGKARVFRNVAQLPDDLERVANWVGVLTGLSLDATQGSITPLDNAAWSQKCDRLKKSGGSPEW
jgi:eukaryotic-like serine/threonine-protein kinase